LLLVCERRAKSFKNKNAYVKQAFLPFGFEKFKNFSNFCNLKPKILAVLIKIEGGYGEGIIFLLLSQIATGCFHGQT